MHPALLRSLRRRQGRYNLDPAVRFFATPPVHGSLCRYVDHPEDFCHEMPDSMSFEEGSLIEPLANALFACMRARVGPGKSVAILGAGTMGEQRKKAGKSFPLNLMLRLSQGGHPYRSLILCIMTINVLID